MNNLFSRLNLALIFSAIGLVYIFGMFIDVMDIDAAQYASISREMLYFQDFLQIKNRLVDYLDKPPLLFWLSSLSFWVFGISNWAYKLPSVLFSVLAIYSTYRFAKIYYPKEVSILSAIVLATCQAYFLINNDVRTDTILIGCIAFASWHLAAYLQQKTWQSFICAFIGIGLAMLSKGPLGLMVPVLGFGIDLLLKREFKKIFQWQWLIGLVVIAIVLFPMCYGLYGQFGIKGLQVYFWDQSFGRVTGSNTAWQNDVGPFFLFHSFLWSFLPWPLVFLAAFYLKIKTLWVEKFKVSSQQEYITVGAILFSYLILSRSLYQLPHYIYGILPFAAVLTASFTMNFLSQNVKWANGFNITQIIVCIGLWSVCGLLTFLCFTPSLPIIVLFGLIVGVFILFIFKKEYVSVNRLIVICCITAIGVNFFMNMHIYPSILKYQPSREIAAYLKSKNVDEPHFFVFNEYAFYSQDFYTRFITKEVYNTQYFDSLVVGDAYYCYTNTKGLDKMKSGNIDFQVAKVFEDYRVTKLSLAFLNPATRSGVISKKYLVKFIK